MFGQGSGGAANNPAMHKDSPAPRPHLPFMALLGIALGATIMTAAGATVPDLPRHADGLAVLGQATAAGGLTVRPLAIREDSRCATGHMCLAPGRLVVDAMVGEGGEAKPATFVLGQPVKVAGGTLVLDRATGPASDDTPLAAPDYQLHFRAVGPTG